MKKFAIAFFLLAVVAASLGAYYTHESPDNQTRVSYLAVTRGDVVESVGATGTLQAVASVMVGSQVSGRIKALHADFNSIVRKGQVVAELDPSLFETQVAQAEAGLTRSEADAGQARIALVEARKTLDRTRTLFERQAASRQELDDADVSARSAEAAVGSADAAIVIAQASLDQARVRLKQAVIRAPIDGIVVSRNVDVGQTVAASLNAPTIFVISGDLTRMQVVASVDEADVGRIRPGQVVRFRVDADPGQEFRGVVSQVRLNPLVSQNVVTYATVIDVRNPTFALRPGMTAYVTIEVARRDGVLRAPNGALRYRPSADIFAELRLPLPPDLRPGADAVTGLDRSQAGGENRQLKAATRTETGAGIPARPKGTYGNRAAAPNDRSSAPTIDRLFGQPPPEITTGRAWIYAGGELKPVHLRLGISDGTWTELVNSPLREGQELVSNIVTPAMAAADATSPSRRGFNPFQGGGRYRHFGPH